MLAGEKTWEMRSRRTHYRGRFGLISSGSGLIFGEATLVDCLPALTLSEAEASFDKHRIPAEEIELLERYRFPWVLKDVEPYDHPIPYNHPRGAVIWVSL